MIKMWLECAVEETNDRGRKTRTTEARDNRRGIPQGSPISPLPANLYMRRFVLGWKMLGLERSLGSRIVTYADDLVILCRKGKAEEALQRLRATSGAAFAILPRSATDMRTRRSCSLRRRSMRSVPSPIAESPIPVSIYPNKRIALVVRCGTRYVAHA
jgi:hypothetical protein